MRNRACLVWIAVLMVCAPTGIVAASEAAASSSGEPLSVPSTMSLRSLPTISIVAREPLPAEVEPVENPPLDLNLILLAAWLPIAGALLALAMESTSPDLRRAREPGGETSLD